MFPDLDYVLHSFGVRYADLWGHRGLVHSIPFAALFALVVSVLYYRIWRKPDLRPRWWALWLFLFCITASHGILDAFTDGGLGIALFSPFDTTRYFMPWQPLPVPDLGLESVFRERFLVVIGTEILLVWMPVMAISAFVLLLRTRRAAP